MEDDKLLLISGKSLNKFKEKVIKIDDSYKELYPLKQALLDFFSDIEEDQDKRYIVHLN